MPEDKKTKKKKEPIKKGRSTYCMSFTGMTGTGKSWQAQKIAKKLSGKQDKVLVLTHSGSGKTWDFCKKTEPTKKGLGFKTGWRKIHFVEHHSTKDKKYPILEVFNYFRNGFIIFDDCKSYLYPDWEAVRGLKELLIDHRHNGVDLAFIGHQPNHIPVQVWSYITHSWVFSSPFKLKEQHINSMNVDKFLKAQEQINVLYKKKYNEQLKKTGSKDKIYGVYKYLDLST